MHSESSEITFEIHLKPGEALSLPEEAAQIVGPGNWKMIVRPADSSPNEALIRDHSAFLSSFAPEDEGLYDDYPTG